jgi:RND family efflux transporter MFP subunit
MSKFSACSSGHALAVCLAAATAMGCGQEAPPPELPPRAIAWERVSGSAVGERRVISGIVTAIDDTALAFEVGGIVESVDVNLGDRVSQDQVLARLDQEPFELNVRDAEAALAEAIALREDAESTYSRFAQAAVSGAVARQEVDSARATRDARISQFDAATARLNLARRDLRRSTLRAPFDGSISAREIDPAMKLASGQIAFEMDSEESGLRVEVQMPETLIARVRQGNEVEVTFPSDRADDGRSYRALVSEVGTRAGAGNAFPVRADLLETPTGARPGMTVEVSFLIPRTETEIVELQGFMIPFSAALAEPDNRFSVFVYDPGSSTVSKRAIETGGVASNAIAVIDGLAEGDIIATAGVSFLTDGQEVTLLDDELIRQSR